jgi:hypothetical protein
MVLMAASVLKCRFLTTTKRSAAVERGGDVVFSVRGGQKNMVSVQVSVKDSSTAQPLAKPT